MEKNEGEMEKKGVEMEKRATGSSFPFLLTPRLVPSLHKLSHQEQSTQGLTGRCCEKRPRADETPL